jgi:hypothetical protein
LPYDIDSEYECLYRGKKTGAHVTPVIVTSNIGEYTPTVESLGAVRVPRGVENAAVL